MNVAPAISPDGKYLAFLSEKDLFGIDLFLADAKTGKILRKLSSQVANSHIDDYNFIKSAGARSPIVNNLPLVFLARVKTKCL